MRTTAGDVPAIRIKSSIDTGLGPSRLGIRAIACVGIGRKRFAVRLPQWKRDRALHDRRDRVDDVGSLGDQRRALFDQIVGACRARIERRARHRKNLAGPVRPPSVP